MTNEEWDRKAEFLLNQQAKFDAGMQELREAQAISEQKITKTAEAAALAVEAVSQLTEVTANLVNIVLEGFRELSDRMKRTDDKINVLIDSQIRTDERFERHLREDHGQSSA